MVVDFHLLAQSASILPSPLNLDSGNLVSHRYILYTTVYANKRYLLTYFRLKSGNVISYRYGICNKHYDSYKLTFSYYGFAFHNLASLIGTQDLTRPHFVRSL